MESLNDLRAYPWFRGLWMSRCIEEDGSVSIGWSVTFVRDGQYYDMAYCKTPAEAFQKALRLAFQENDDEKASVST